METRERLNSLNVPSSASSFIRSRAETLKWKPQWPQILNFS